MKNNQRTTQDYEEPELSIFQETPQSEGYQRIDTMTIQDEELELFFISISQMTSVKKEFLQ